MFLVHFTQNLLAKIKAEGWKVPNKSDYSGVGIGVESRKS